MIPALFLGLMIPQLALCLAVLRKRPTPLRVAGVNACLLSSGGVLTAMLGLFGNRLFLPMQLSAWLVFALWPALLLGGALLLWEPHRRLAISMTGLGALLLLTATWSMGIEPRWAETTTHRITSQELDAPLRIVLVADLQTDTWGRFERRIFERVGDAQPDLVLFAGDYLQPDDLPAWERLLPHLQAALRPVCQQATLGCVGVRGDVDPDVWARIFDGARAEVVTHSRSIAMGPLVVTALNLADSRSDAPPVPVVDGLHVVLGHAPDFATSALDADLLLAGHIHGGQVRVPGLGPLFTLSRVPRDWATGRTELPTGGTLIVSRGLGLERGDAPPLRMFCRPELVVIDVVPDEITLPH